MTHVVRILVGSMIGVVVLWASVAFYGLLAVWSPWSNEWWKHHIQVVMIGSTVIAVLPCVLGLGLLLDKMYKVHPAPSALASMTIALLVGSADTLRTPELIGPTIRLTWQVLLPFLIVPPSIVFLMNAVRSNNRIERTRER